MSQLQASPMRIAYSTAFLLVFGKVPGCPMVIGLICVLGGAPNAVLSPQNNLLLVANCACTSKPITASYFPFNNIIDKNTADL